MAKRNPVARFDIKSIINILDRIKFELTRKTGQDNRLSFKFALLVAEVLRQLTFTTRKNDLNLNYIKTAQCYNLAGIFLYIFPKLIILFEQILLKLSEDKDPIRYNKFKNLVNISKQFTDGIYDDDFLKRIKEESESDDEQFDEFGELKKPKDNYFYKK